MIPDHTDARGQYASMTMVDIAGRKIDQPMQLAHGTYQSRIAAMTLARLVSSGEGVEDTRTSWAMVTAIINVICSIRYIDITV
jgi:hypothetical protein